MSRPWRTGALLREAERLAPDVIVLDIAMPGLNGIDATRQIAGLPSLSSRTVEFHKHRIMQDLGLHSTAGLTRYALRHGIVTN